MRIFVALFPINVVRNWILPFFSTLGVGNTISKSRDFGNKFSVVRERFE